MGYNMSSRPISLNDFSSIIPMPSRSYVCRRRTADCYNALRMVSSIGVHIDSAIQTRFKAGKQNDMTDPIQINKPVQLLSFPPLKYATRSGTFDSLKFPLDL